MKGLTAAILASGLVLYALMSLMAADRSRDASSSLSDDNDQQTVADLGARFGWRH